MSSSRNVPDRTARVQASSDGQATWYRLPHLPPDDAQGGKDLAQAMKEARDHLSRLKFILFLRDIQDRWPRGIARLGIQYDTQYNNVPLWRVRCWKKSRAKPASDPFPGTATVPADPVVPGMELVATPASFSRFITNHEVQDDPGFAALAAAHLAHAPVPGDKAWFSDLELSVLSPSDRAHLLASQAHDTLPPARPSRSLGPGRL